jgi:carboxylate-amine ligase
VAQSLVAWLGDRHEAGEPLGIAPNWRIAENSWSACRYGVEGEMADLLTGELSPTRASLQMLLEVLQGVAARLGAERSLKHARDLTEMNGAVMQRRVWAKGGADAVARWLADRFLEPWPG